MERVAFLIESTGERIGCLLNPETLTVQRSAGVARRAHASTPLAASELTDDSLLYTGGGATEMELDLLFDTSLVGSSMEISDVRTLTRPLWDLAETRKDETGRTRVPMVRFIWGRGWNIPGIIAAVAERMDAFTPEGLPTRSWLRMRFVRVTPPQPDISTGSTSVDELGKMLPGEDGFRAVASMPAEAETAVELTGGDDGGAFTPTRLDELAYRHLGEPSKWRLIAWFNDLADPLRVGAGTLLHIPPLKRTASGGTPDVRGAGAETGGGS